MVTNKTKKRTKHKINSQRKITSGETETKGRKRKIDKLKADTLQNRRSQKK